VYKTLDTVTEYTITFSMIDICLYSYMEFCFEIDIDFKVQVSTVICHHMKENKSSLLK